MLHATPPAETEALLRAVAAMPHWTAIHVMIVIPAVFMVGGVGLLMRTRESRALGITAVVGGAICLLHGVSTALQFTLPVPVWPLGAAVDSFWLAAVGVVMLRRST